MKGSIFTANERSTLGNVGELRAVVQRQAVVYVNNRMHSFVLERFPMWGRAKMLGVLLSWLIQLFLVCKLFFFRACFFFSQPFLAPAHSGRRPARWGRVQMPAAGWFAALWSPAPRTLLLLTARMNNYQSGLSHKSVPSVQGALFAEQKDLEGLKGYGFKNSQLNGRKDAVTCFYPHAGALLPPETFRITFITCSHASARPCGVLFGDRVTEAVILPATDRFCFVYKYFTGFGLIVLSSG